MLALVGSLSLSFPAETPAVNTKAVHDLRKISDHPIALNSTEKVLKMAYSLRAHADKKGDKALSALAQKTIDMQRKDALFVKGDGPHPTTAELVDQFGMTYSPRTAARAGMEWTVQDNDAQAKNHDHGVGGDLEESTKAEDNGAYQGDMMPEDDKQLARWKALAKGAVVTKQEGSVGAGTPWSNNYVPYCYASDVKPDTKLANEDAIIQFNKAVPGITFKDVGLKNPNTPGASWTTSTECNEAPAVFVSSVDAGCYSYVGMIPSWKSQQLNLESPGCDSLGTAIHEMLHALGQAHEQSRNDRDTYVKVNFDIIQEGYSHNFDIDTYGDMNRAYDMLSVMHYHATAFSTTGAETIETLPAAYGLYTTDETQYDNYQLGNRVGMTQLDADQLADQYGTTANTLLESTTCTDVPGENGGEWNDGRDGYNCDFYYQVLGDDCGSGYVSASACCACGGGLRPQDWQEGATARSPPPPAPHVHPSPPNSPPPPLPGTGLEGSAYVVYYNTWKVGGDQYCLWDDCIPTCDADPTCVGLQYYSNQQYQGYKIETVPTGLEDGISMDAAKALPGTWSVYIKNELYVAPPPPPPNPTPGTGLEDSAYVVYYDKWIQGGDQYALWDDCIPTCDADSTCLGLQFYSNQQYQCYKIETDPGDLGEGISMDAAKALPGTWSVFMKNELYVAPSPSPPPPPPPPSPERTGPCEYWCEYYTQWYDICNWSSCTGCGVCGNQAKSKLPAPPMTAAAAKAKFLAKVKNAPKPAKSTETVAAKAAKGTIAIPAKAKRTTKATPANTLMPAH